MHLRTICELGFKAFSPNFGYLCQLKTARLQLLVKSIGLKVSTTLFSMKKISTLLIIAAALILASCSGKKKDGFDVKGTWSLERVVHPSSERTDYPDNDISWLRIYDDSCYYDCQAMKAPTGTMIIPGKTETYTLIERGKNEYLYLQDGGKHPFVIESDSTIMIQENGAQYTWKICDEFDEKKVGTIVNIVKNDVNNHSDSSNRYVFSYREEELQERYTILAFIFLFVVVVGVNYFVHVFKQKKRIEKELRMIEQEQSSIPEPVREAMINVEEEFHNSAYYISLRNKITQGAHFTDEEWQEMSEKLKNVYPRFLSTLHNVCNMTKTELQVCILLKLNSTPTEIANVLCKEKNSISSIRTRLYNKHFGKKGGSKEWDEFIHSL